LPRKTLRKLIILLLAVEAVAVRLVGVVAQADLEQVRD
jgi:hypothetical protein